MPLRPPRRPAGGGGGSDGEATVRCGRCSRPLLVDEVRFAGWQGPPERLICPVCDATVVIDVYRAAIRGVRKVI